MLRRNLLASASLLVLVPSVAAAQTAPGGDASTADENIIIVTGEKTNRTLQETTTSVAVTTDEKLQTENIQTLEEVIQRTANMTETYGNAGFTIRGLANKGISSGGDAPLATVYIDGAPIPKELTGQGPTDTWDVAQIEILRGPQSTIQGLNALAGAIVMTTKDPTFYWDAKARFSYDDNDTRSFAFAGGGPLIDDELAFRVSAEKRDSDGFIYNVTRDEPEDPEDSTQIRAKLLWTPSSIEGFEARIGYTHFERFGGYDFQYARTDVPDFFENRTSILDDLNSSSVESDMFNVKLDYDLSDSLSFTSVSNYSDNSLYRTFDNDFTSQPLGRGLSAGDFETISQEFRLGYESDRFEGLFGLFYYNRKQEGSSENLTIIPTPLDVISGLLQSNGVDAATAGYIAGLYGAALPSIAVDVSGTTPSEVETMAVFADGRYALTDRLSLMAGFRYDRETNALTNNQVAEFVGILPDPAAFDPTFGQLYFAIAGINQGVLGLVADANGSAPLTKRKFEAFLPKGGVEMAWTDDLSTSFVVQRGYRSGGTSVNLARSQTSPYNPEYTWNYELSLRSQWLDGALTLNANVFYIDWKEQQTVINLGLNVYDTLTVNAGKSHVFGFEVEASHFVSDSFDYYASIGHTATEFDAFETTIASVTDLSGLEFPYAPKWTFAAGFNLRQGGFRLNMNMSHRTSVFGDVVTPQEATRESGRTLVNARLGYDFGNYELSLFANNIFDEKYIQYRAPGFDTALLGAPRVVGVVLEVGL